MPGDIGDVVACQHRVGFHGVKLFELVTHVLEGHRDSTTWGWEYQAECLASAVEEWPSAARMVLCPILNVVDLALDHNEHFPLRFHFLRHLIHRHARYRLRLAAAA